MARGDQPASAPSSLRLAKPTDARAVNAEPLGDNLIATAALNDVGCGLKHGGIMRLAHEDVNAIIARPVRFSSWKLSGDPCEFRTMTADDLKAELEELGISRSELARNIGHGDDPSKINKVLGKEGRRLQLVEAAAIRAFFDKVRARRLARGDPASEDDEPHMGNQPDQPDPPAAMADMITVPEYDVRLSAGGGFVVNRETTRRQWPLPRFLIRENLGLSTRPGALTIQEVVGDSMEPTLHSGDFVLIDLTDGRLGVPGIFAVWDGDALVCKRLERVPGSEPGLVRMKSDNPLHSTYEVPADRVNIVGRVRWFTRRM